MKKITVLLFILFSISLYAQKVKVKKGEILLNNNKVGYIEKIKVKGANNYLKIFDSEKNHLYNAKLVSEESKFFGKLKRSNYFIIECLKQNDSIGIEELSFYLGEKQVAKYLTQKGILKSNGFDDTITNEILSKTGTKPSYALKKVEKENQFIENIDYLVSRDTSNPIFVEEKKSTFTSGYSIIDGKSVKQTKYELFQGKDKISRALIGYAYLEIPEMGRSKLIISNSKDVPIGYFDNFNHYTFYPLTKLKIKLSKIIRLDKPIEAINQFSQMLIDENKL